MEDKLSTKRKLEIDVKQGKSKTYYQLLEKRQLLPAWEAKSKLFKLLEENQIIIIQGETGSGKTTQVPQFLVDSPFLTPGKGIAVTQPRRVAAMSVAKRVSEEMDVVLGQEVGYSIRFEDLSSRATRLKYMTDGMLLRESIGDPLLNRYSIVCLDESHERTINTDILFGFMKEITQKRKDLKLIVMSATMDIEKFQQYFDAPVLDIPGRVFPVQILYSDKPQKNYLESAIDTAFRIHLEEEPGDVLVFLTGEEEIETACEELRDRVEQQDPKRCGPIDVIPLYSTLPPAQQQRIFRDAPKANKFGVAGRKVIFSTNVAETSLTIDGIVYVVDPGLSKQKIYNPRVMIESLLVSPISKASAKQRAGRAGRTRPGKCFRLYTEESFNEELQENTFPEIQRSNLSSVILNLKKLGIDDIIHFDYMDPPAPETMMRALELLNYMGALCDEGDLTELGNLMAQIPLEPELAKMLLYQRKKDKVEGSKGKLIPEVISLVSMLSVQNPFIRPKNFASEADSAKAQFKDFTGDHLTLLNVFNSFMSEGDKKTFCNENYLNYRSLKAAADVRNQLENICTNLGFSLNAVNYQAELPEKKKNILIKAILSGYFANIAHLQLNNLYFTVKDNQIVSVHPSTTLNSKYEWLVYHEFVLTKSNYIRTVTKIPKPEYLFEVAWDYYDNLEEFPNGHTRRTLEKIRKELS